VNFLCQLCVNTCCILYNLTWSSSRFCQTLLLRDFVLVFVFYNILSDNKISQPNQAQTVMKNLQFHNYYLLALAIKRYLSVDLLLSVHTELVVE